MKERPIIFDAESVRAILEGRKTQTRRVVKPQPYFNTLCGGHWYWSGTNRWNSISVGCPTIKELVSNMLQQVVCLAWPNSRCPYGQLGDRLWVRETWQLVKEQGYTYETDYGPESDSYWTLKEDRQVKQTDLGEWLIDYRADSKEYVLCDMVWRSPIHMPRWASRTILEVTDVRVERIQDISFNDAIAEGCSVEHHHDEIPPICDSDGMLLAKGYIGPKAWFLNRWDALNAKRGFSWPSNPWVWVVEFKLVRQSF